MTWADFAREIGRPYQTVYSALARGQTPEQIAGPKPAVRTFPGTSWRHPRPELEPELARQFDVWRRKLNKAHKHYGYIDVFHFLTVFQDYMVGKRHFDPILEELIPEDEARLEADPAYQRWRLREERLRYALECIRERDPKLANQFTPRRHSAWDWIERRLSEAIRPDDPWRE